jgi:hypothetical protein
MSIEEFRDNDADYLDWMAGHRIGYVINLQRDHNPRDARLHKADCRTITGRPPRGRTWTGPYVKVCAITRGELDEWALRHCGARIQQCGICWPRPSPRATTEMPAARSEVTGDSWYEFDDRGDDGREVRLRADRYIPFERLSPEQIAIRAKLRHRLGALAAAPGEILHAGYAGFKPAHMDVENLVLYNIYTGGRCFVASTRHGVRFELARGASHAPDGSLACTYTYRMAPASSEPIHWRRTRRVATFRDAALGPFGAAKRLEQTWLATRRSYAKRLIATGIGLDPAAPVRR